MPGSPKPLVLESLEKQFGKLSKLTGSQSLYTIGTDAARIYFRYSKLHGGERAFFGLRKGDLAQLEGQNGFICLLVDDGSPPVFIPYSDFEELLRFAQPASDGQYKVQLFSTSNARELYIARQGRFNVEGFVGYDAISRSMVDHKCRPAHELSHSQIQTLLAGIGNAKGYDVYVPDNNIRGLDWSLTRRFSVRRGLPRGYDEIASVLCEIDVLWVSSGRNSIASLFEVEHSTSIYTGLLRFNDVLLVSPDVTRFSIVSNDTRRASFSRQAFRPTFRKSGLSELVGFLEYDNVFDWHQRLVNPGRA